MANPSLPAASRCAFPAARPGSSRQATRELQVAAITSVTRLMSWNQWRVEVTPQRVQTDCTGRNCSPQFSQNKRASQTGSQTVPSNQLRLLARKPARLLYLGTGLPNPPTPTQLATLDHDRPRAPKRSPSSVPP